MGGKKRTSSSNAIQRWWEAKIDGAFGSILSVLITAVLLIVFIVILKELYQLFAFDLWSSSSSTVIDAVLTIFLEMKLFQVLLHYLQNHRIEVEVIAEVGIIAIVKEVMFKFFEFSAMHLFGIAAVLVALGALFFIEKRYGCDDSSH